MSKIADTREVILTSDSTGEHWSAALWDPRTGSALLTYKGASALAPRTLQLLGDSYVVGADATKPRIHVWPINSHSPVPNLRLTPPGKVSALCCSPSGAYIVAAVSEKLFVWQTCNGRLVANVAQHYQTVSCLSFSKDGSMFASGAEDGLIFVWSLFVILNDPRPSAIHSFSQHSLPVKDLQFGHSGSRARLCSVSLDRTCNIYEPTSGTLLLTLVFNVPLTSVCMNVRESDLFIGCIDGNIHRFNLHEPPRGIEHHVQMNESAEDAMIFRSHKSSVVCLSVSIDSRYLLSGSTSGAVHIWDIASRQVLRSIDHKGPITAAFFTKQYENFRVAELKPSLHLSNLQRMSNDADRENFLHVIGRHPSPADLLSFESFVESNNECQAAESTSRRLLEAREEIERLKRINAEIYQYSIKHIFNNKKEVT